MLRSLANSGDTATPSRPPSPSGRTPGILPSTVRRLARPTCSSSALSRRVTRAEPSGRNAMAHGTSRSVAMVPLRAGRRGRGGRRLDAVDVVAVTLGGVSGRGRTRSRRHPSRPAPEQPPTSSTATTAGDDDCGPCGGAPWTKRCTRHTPLCVTWIGWRCGADGRAWHCARSGRGADAVDDVTRG